MEEVAGKPLTTAKWIGRMLVVTLGVYGLGWFFASSMDLVFWLTGFVLMTVVCQSAREIGISKYPAILIGLLAHLGHWVIVFALRYKPVLEFFVSAVTG